MSKTEMNQKMDAIDDNLTEHQVDALDLREIAAAVWEGKWLVMCVTLIVSICSVFYALQMPDEYKSTVILSPASASNASSLSKFAGQFGGLASIAGVSLGGNGGINKTAIAIELMQTWGFLETFIRNNQLEKEVYAATGWNSISNELLFDRNIYDAASGRWVSQSESGDEIKPTSWGLYQSIRGKIGIFQDAKSGLVSLTIEHFSPHVAKRWADLLVEAINRHIQSQDRADALSSIEYLKKQIKKTSIAEMRSIYYQLIEEQTKKLMLAEISTEYVFKTLSPAKVAEQKSKPARSLIVMLGFMLGGGLAVFVVLIRFFIKNQ